MTKKEATNLLYNTLENQIYLESQIMNGKEFSIFKSGEEETYMICVLNDFGESYVSEKLTTISECHDWVNQN